MRYASGHVSLEVPDTLEDRSVYQFDQRPFDHAAGGSPDKVTVSFEPMSEHVAPEAMIAEVRAGMERFPGFTIEFSEGEARAGTWPARTLHAVLAGSWHILVAAFRWPGALMATIRFESARADVAPSFARAVASVRALALDARPEPALDPLWVRRSAGRLSLELPRALAFPDLYQFLSRDERILLLVRIELRPLELEPDFGDWLSAGVGEVLDAQRLPLAEPRVVGPLLLQEGDWQVERLSALGEIVESRRLRVARVRLGNGVGVRVTLSERDDAGLGDAGWHEIVTSLRLTAAAHPDP